MFEDEVDRYLPWSARRYKVDIHGQVLDKENNIITPYEKNGHMFVDLEWVIGKRSYLVALVILVGFKKISIEIFQT